jgi:hypothetical protein
MNDGQLLGILLGGLAGYTLSQLDVLRHRSFGPSSLYVAGFTLAGGFFGSVIGKGVSATQAQGPQQVTASPDVLAWQRTPFGDVNDSNSPAYACAQAIQERAAGVNGPWSAKCNAWRNQ